MKNKFKLLIVGILSAVVLIPCIAFTQSPGQKKTRHIRMVKVENGKKMEIDTVLTGDDVFVWNGDTINPEKHIKKFSPAEFDKRHPEKVHRIIMHADSGEDVRIITEEGDTLGEKIFIHKGPGIGSERDHLIYLGERQNAHFPPVPGVPPVPHIRRFKGMHSSNGINLNDPNVISFKKKDIGGGREKIEIIRKKTNESDNREIDMDIEDVLQVPEPPMPPVLHGEMDQDAHQKMMHQEMEVKTKKNEKKDTTNDPSENK
jgi:hypothetical protein